MRFEHFLQIRSPDPRGKRQPGRRQPDYWDLEFDTDKNCEEEEEISRLTNLKTSQCKSVDVKGTGDDDQKAQKAFMKCKTQLDVILKHKCDYWNLDSPGELLYCKIKWRLTCCFRNETCST